MKPKHRVIFLSSGILLALLGSSGILSFTGFFLLLARIRPDYIPMAPDTGMIFLIFGLILIFESAAKPTGWIRKLLVGLVSLISLYGILKFIEYFLRIDITFGNLLFPTGESLNQFPVHRMSPVTGALFFFSGLAYFLSRFRRPSKRMKQLVNLTGLLVLTVGGVGLIGYLFDNPFLYSGNVIPMAALTTVSFCALGLGIMLLAEEESYVNRLFSRSTTRGRLMGVVVPLVVSVILIQGFIESRLDRAGLEEHSLVSALMALLFIILTPILIIRITQQIYRHNERTEREQLETQEQLLHERMRLRTLIDNLPDRIFFKDRSGRFMIASKGVAVHSGLASPDEIEGKTDFDLYPVGLAQQYFNDEQDLMMRGVPLLNHEEPSCDASGKLGWTLTSKIPIRNLAGQVIGLVGVSRDITELKKSNEDLLHAKESAEQANKLKDYFISNLSHEIRTPLNAIIGFSELLQEEVQEVLPEISEKYFPIITSSGQRLIRTIDLILSLSRLQSGLYVSQLQPVDLDRTVRDLMAEYQPDALQKNLQLTFDNAIGPVVIESDAYCVVQSLRNLIENAVKYTYRGYVTVRLYQDKPGRIKLDVQDTGIGIRKEYLQRLFEPFSQEDASTTRQFEGIGLGLAITRKLLDAISARITVASTKDVGTTFTISFRKSAEGQNPRPQGQGY